MTKTLKVLNDVEALLLLTINVATCYSWLLLPDNNILDVLHQFMFFVQTSAVLAVAGCCQCTAVAIATNEASTETFNEACAGRRPLLLANICSINKHKLVRLNCK